MFVEEIHIEGFKSYAKKTTLSGFDPHFNAITGLNGSGKSNILDSICFVLGITNLSQVRAGNLQDLVYKQGQAGITKASVSITFDNSDKKNSPVGYEDKDKITVTRQVVIGGKNKYLINGHLAQPGKVQTLFHSVQLNVNNPHFLIMQGRITKVLNMKPPEILGMLEEAAGTRMYENKKENALRTLKKKDLKVEEINNILDNDILPALERLRGERAQYLEWMANKSNVERLQRVCVAHDFWKADTLAESSAESHSSMCDLAQSMRSSSKHTEHLVAELDKEIKRLKQTRDTHRGEDVDKLESQEKEISKVLVKETTVWEHQRKQVLVEKENIDKIENEKKAALSNVSSAEKKVEQCKQQTQEIEGELQSHTKKMQRIETELNGFVVSATDAKSKTIGEVLAETKQDVLRLESDIKQISKKIDRRESDLKKKTKDLERFEAEKVDMEMEAEKIEKKVQELSSNLESIQYEPDREAQLKKEVNTMSATIRELKSKAQLLSAQLVKFDFQYVDPSPDFDHSSVKGVVAKLVHVDEPEYITALEVVAGSKLNNVVVDNEKTAAALLKRGQLKSRVTIIPLNKIDAKAIQSPVRSQAQKLVGKDNARVAIELIGYDDQVENAMKYVFGKAFVCTDSIAAQKVAFSKDIRKTCVTKDGDLLNPSGTLTGGSRPTSLSVLSKLQDLSSCESEIKRLEGAIASKQIELQKLDQANEQSRSQEQDLNLAKHELELLTTRISQSAYSKTLKEAEEIKAEILQLSSSRQSLTEEKVSKAEDVEVFQRQIKDFGKSREGSRSQLEKSLEAGRRELSVIQKKLQEGNNKVEMAMLELESAKEEVESIEEQLTEARKLYQEAENQVGGDPRQAQGDLRALFNVVSMISLSEQQAAAAEALVKRTNSKYESVKAELDKKLENLLKHDKKMSTVAQEKEKLEKQLTEQELELNSLEGRIKRALKESEEARGVLEELLQRNSWIETERRYFNQPGSDYDFSRVDPEESKKEYERLLDEQEKAGKRINKKVMSMFDKAEQEYRELREKKEIVLRDKAKIEQAIEELDEKKKEALSKTWQKVDKDFGSIFSTLLPGTQAKLVPQEDRDFMDGLEVKVAFGDVWKQSLSELSGGQRSLLALSLILAMLLFKPAPIYILDEVDAALDLSHTQNIGRMIKRCFPYSQFLVVSLKPGLFSNANCIFTTKFVDGVSTVVKTSGKPEAHHQLEDSENDKENVYS